MIRLSFVAAFALLATAASAQDAPAPQPATPAISTDEGLAAWDEIYTVASHPRCANCHVGADNLPVWSGPSYGKRRPHGMNISGGESRIGAEFIPCQTCHMEKQSGAAHAAPGAPHWQLAPVEMQWIDKSSAQICAQFKDPAMNGGRSLDEMAVHVRDDALVAWGWTPGGGREPAPGSAEATYRALKVWEAAGAPCPAG